MVLLFMMLPLFSNDAVPAELMAFTGKLNPAGVIAQLEMVLPSFPTPVLANLVEKKIVPVEAEILEPAMVQLVMVLLLASLIN
jgi:hypothetical protein